MFTKWIFNCIWDDDLQSTLGTGRRTRKCLNGFSGWFWKFPSWCQPHPKVRSSPCVVNQSCRWHRSEMEALLERRHETTIFGIHLLKPIRNNPSWFKSDCQRHSQGLIVGDENYNCRNIAKSSMCVQPIYIYISPKICPKPRFWASENHGHVSVCKCVQPKPVFFKHFFWCSDTPKCQRPIRPLKSLKTSTSPLVASRRWAVASEGCSKKNMVCNQM